MLTTRLRQPVQPGSEMANPPSDVDIPTPPTIHEASKFLLPEPRHVAHLVGSSPVSTRNVSTTGNELLRLCGAYAQRASATRRTTDL